MIGGVSFFVRTLCVSGALWCVCASSNAAPLEVAAVPVTLSIQQSCLIHSGEAGSQDMPVVQCEHDEVFAISTVEAEPALVSEIAPVGVTQSRGGMWMVAF